MVSRSSAHKHPAIIAASILLLILLWVSPLPARDIPQLSGHVNDTAGMLHASTKNQLEAVLTDLEKTDSTQVAVLTIDSLEGDSLEDFSMRVAEQWKIGQKGTDNGAILLVARRDRKIRIEVGYGLEGKLTDLTAGRIIRDVIAPQFKSGRFDQGISAGVGAIIAAVRGEYTAPAGPVSRNTRRNSGGLPIGLLMMLFFVHIAGRIKRPLGAAAGGLFAPIAGATLFNLGWLATLALIPVGLVGGLLLGVFGSPLSFGHTSGHGRGGFGGGLGGGGFSSGGFGGFSGGGGGFGGGGASGGW
jgi:uncharacterized protein